MGCKPSYFVVHTQALLPTSKCCLFYQTCKSVGIALKRAWECLLKICVLHQCLQLCFQLKTQVIVEPILITYLSGFMSVVNSSSSQLSQKHSIWCQRDIGPYILARWLSYSFLAIWTSFWKWQVNIVHFILILHILFYNQCHLKSILHTIFFFYTVCSKMP